MLINLLSLCIFDKNNTGVMFALPSTSYQEVHDVDMSYDGDVNFEHLVEVRSARFLHVVTIFPFVIYKYLVGRYF